MRVLVILPALNEGRSIAQSIRGIRAALPRADILIVNDGSSDDTAGRGAWGGRTGIEYAF